MPKIDADKESESNDDVNDCASVDLNGEDDLGYNEYVLEMDMDDDSKSVDDMDNRVSGDLTGEDNMDTSDKERATTKARVHKYQQ